MSAFVVTEEHIKELAAFWATADHWTRKNEDDATKVARVLLAENLRSVRYRYPGDDELPGPIETPEADTLSMRLRDIANRKVRNPVWILKMADCLEYQSCETPDWKDTEAKALLDSIRRLAIAKLPGYDEAPWGYARGAA